MSGRRLATLATLAIGAWVVACGGDKAKGAGAAAPLAPGGSKDPTKWPADDRSMCDWKNKPDLEVSVSTGTGSIRPNVRRVYKVFGEGENRHKTLICREADTNLDGIKDVVRFFNPKGEAVREEADRDFDGRIDVWIKFVDGRIAEEDLDTNRDGKPDVWKFYLDGRIQRVRRDRDFDGKPDIWEIYKPGDPPRLERVGYDETQDGHVDRWDRDEQLRYAAEAEERKALEGDAGAPAAEGDAGSPTATDAGAPADKPKPKKPKRTR